jgi:hypothetical protein
MLATLVAVTLLTSAVQAGDDDPAPVKKNPAVKPTAPGPKLVLKVEDKLTNDDAKDKVRANSVCKIHGINLQAGRTYTIDLVSKDFDAYLRLEDPEENQLAADDDSGGGLNARIVYNCTTAGMYRIIATTFSGGVGDYTLTVQETKSAKVPTRLLLFNKEGVAKAASSLTATDPLDKVRTQSHVKAYMVKLKAGKTYVIDLKSKDFDSFLRLENAGGQQLAEDDDSGGGLDARITFTCENDGIYRILATSLVSKTGLFTLAVQQKGATGGTTPGKSVVAPLDLKDGTGSVEAALTVDDARDKVLKNSPVKTYAVKCKAGTTYVIDLKSTDFDAFLRLEDADGKQLAQDDDSGGGLDAQIVFTCETDGTYNIMATALNGRPGNFKLTVQQK